MDDRKIKFRVGVMVFSTGLIAAILIILLGDRPALFHKTWPIEIHLPDAPSVAENTPIRKSGVLIGRVTKVKLIPTGGVIINAAINDDVKIFTNEVCQVQSSIFGDTNLRLVIPTKKKPSGKWLKPNGVIQGDISLGLQGNLEMVVSSISKTSKQLNKLISKVDKVFADNGQSINQIIEQTNSILTSVKKTTDFTDKLLNNDQINSDEFRNNLAHEISLLPNTFADAREAISSLRMTMKNMNSTMKLLDENLANIRDFTEPLGENAPQMVDNMKSAISRLDTVLEEFEQFSKTINSNQGTLGKLLHDDALYQRLNQAACNIQQVSSKLRPIVNDVRILTDKMARHPGSLIRDAIILDAGTKGPVPPRNW